MGRVRVRGQGSGVRGWEIHYINESPHIDAGVCVCGGGGGLSFYIKLFIIPLQRGFSFSQMRFFFLSNKADVQK